MNDNPLTRRRPAAAGMPSLLLATLLLLALPRPGAPQPAHVSDYMGYVTKHLPRAKGYKRDVLVAIRDLYVDLAAQRKPRSVALPSGLTAVLHPLSFSIPEEHVGRVPPPKTKYLSMPYWAKSNVPAEHFATSASSDGEKNYYEALSRSFYSLTVRKSGNDCLRHLEILAAGAVPLFTDIALAHPSALSSYPKRLFAVLLREPALTIQGVQVNDRFNITVNETRLDVELYMVTVQALLSYTRTVLTTGAMAQHVLTVMGVAPTKVLFLSFRDEGQAKRGYVSHTRGDYMSDTLLHGFKRLLGQGAVVDFERRKPQYRDVKDLSMHRFLVRRAGHYGDGFSYACKLFEADGVVDRENLAQRIRDQEFDLVVFGEAHRADLTQHALYEDVCKHVPPGSVAAVWGGDGPPTQEQMPMLESIVKRGCIKFLFSREIHG